MTRTVIPVPATPCLPVRGSDALFPVRRIYCVGRNFAEHAKEMGASVDRGNPVFFMKPADAIVAGGGTVPYPPGTRDLHHEVELVVALGRDAADVVPVGDALDLVFGYGVGLDLTRRDLQAAAKKAGRPWDMAKGFDLSGPIGEIVPASHAGHPSAGKIELTVNGVVRQTSDLAKQIWNVEETIAYLSGLVELKPGDLIFTGTPEGVAAVNKGDVLEGVIAGVGTVRTRIA